MDYPRKVSRVYVKKTEVKQEPIDLSAALSIRFQIDKQAIEVWFDPHSKALKISSLSGNLRVRPRSDNVIIVEAVRFDEL